MVIDCKNRVYALMDGVVHISPNIIVQSKHDLKITSGDLLSKRTSLQFRNPATAGVSQEALTHMPMPDLWEGEHLVSDQLVLHTMGVVLAQQYSMDKGICLFGDRAR